MKKLIPIYDDTAAIACTIGEDEVDGRVELLERMRTSLEVVERTEHGLLLRFPKREDVEADVRRFAVDEQRCCAFWGFDVGGGEDEVTLRWDSPPTAAGLLERLHDYLVGDEPITSLGLL
jgi:hypothetical protein